MNSPLEPQSNDPLIGAVLDGRYEVLRRVGAGGMAVVYEVRRLGLKRAMAIKVLMADLAEDPANVKRFLREARAASAIQHENIVDIVDFGAVESRPVYFVMEYLEGVDLKAFIGQRGRLSWPLARHITVEIIGALEAAHDQGIVHRDVKPANCFILPSGDPQRPRVKVLDFGIAKLLADSNVKTRSPTITGGVVGTVAYMSPEQAYGREIDARSDIYGLGVVLYELLTGTVPFRRENPFAVLAAHVNEPPRPPRSLEPSIPEAVEAIVLRCLQKRREDRFQSMRELREALLGAHESARPPLPRRHAVGATKGASASGLSRAALGASVLGLAFALGVAFVWMAETGSTTREVAAPRDGAQPRPKASDDGFVAGSTGAVVSTPEVAAPVPSFPVEGSSASDETTDSPGLGSPPASPEREARKSVRKPARGGDSGEAGSSSSDASIPGEPPPGEPKTRMPGRTHHPDLLDLDL